MNTADSVLPVRAVSRAGLLDVLLPLGLLVIGLIILLPPLRRAGLPVEDAAMLLRYSDHLANHQGITWNVGEHPVEGATDFLYMAAIAGVAKVAHVDALRACRILLFFCSLLLPLVVFTAARWSLKCNVWLAAALGLYVASLANASYMTTGFGAPFMMLMVAFATWVAVTMIADSEPIGLGQALLFSLAALTIGLTRPEGNALAILLLLSVCFMRGLRRSIRLIAVFAAVFIVLGGSYFLWRLHYFGYLFPNPFYVKGKGHLHIQALIRATENVAKILWPLLPLALLGIRNLRRTKLLLALLIPVVGYTAIWILLSNENNHLARFQMPLVPVTALYLPLLLEGLFAELGISIAAWSHRTRLGLQVAAALYTVAVCMVMYNTLEPPTSSQSGRQFAEYLGQYSDRGYTMAVTEAGTFPYFSRWRTIDLLGLNDVTIAHQGLDEAYLDRNKPELILYHLYTPHPDRGALHRDDSDISQRDMHAITVAHAYAVHNNYVLAAAYGSNPCGLHFFYVRPNTPDTDAIVSYIRNTTYYYLDSGILSVDFRNGVRPECHFPDLGN